MLSMKEWMELIKYRVTEGDSYGWGCYGSDAYSLDSWSGVYANSGYSSSIIFDVNTLTVYEVTVCDYTNNRAYRLINPEYEEQYIKEAQVRGINQYEAWDDVSYIDLECDDDFMQKTSAIVEGKPYDTRISVYLDIPNDVLLSLFMAAHERDITVNQYVEEILLQHINEKNVSEDFILKKVI